MPRSHGELAGGAGNGPLDQDQGFALGENVGRERHLEAGEWGAWWRCDAEGLDPLATPKSFAAWWGDTSQEFHQVTM